MHFISNNERFLFAKLAFVCWVVSLTPQANGNDYKCSALYGVCYSVMSDFEESGPNAVMIINYDIPSLSLFNELGTPAPCRRSNNTVKDWCTAVIDSLAPVNVEISRLKENLRATISVIDQTVEPFGGRRSRRQKRFIWDALRLIIPDQRFDKINDAVGRLANQQSTIMAIQSEMSDKMVALSSAMDDRITKLSNFATDHLERVNTKIVEITTAIDHHLFKFSEKIEILSGKIDSLARITALLAHQLVVLSQLSTTLSEFRMAIGAITAGHLTPLLIPPITLMNYLQFTSGTLQSSEYEFMYPQSALHHYYHPSMRIQAVRSEDNSRIILIVPIPTKIKTYKRKLVSVTSFSYPMPVKIGQSEHTGVLKISPETSLFVVSKPDDGVSIEGSTLIAKVHSPSEVRHLPSGAVTSDGLFWSKPQDFDPFTCNGLLFSRWLSGKPITEDDREVVSSFCHPNLRKVSTVVGYRIMPSQWHIIVPVGLRPEISMFGAGMATNPFNRMNKINLHMEVNCHIGCVINVPCGYSVRVSAGASTFSTSLEQNGCQYSPDMQNFDNMTVSTYITSLAKLLVPDLPQEQKQSTDATLKTIRDQLLITQEDITKFRQTDEEISVLIKSTISNITKMKVSLSFLQDQIKESNEKISKDMNSYGRASIIWRLIYGFFLAISIGATIYMIVMCCGTRFGAGAVGMKLLGRSHAQFVLSPQSETFSVVITNSILANPDLWGFIVGMCLLMFVVIVMLIVYKKIRSNLEDQRAASLSSIVFQHLGPIINANLPSLTGQALPVLANIPRVLNLNMKYPTFENPKCQVLVWIRYNYEGLGNINFLTTVGTVECVDRDSIIEINIKKSSIKMMSPGDSTYLEGSIEEIVLRTPTKMCHVPKITLKLSIPPSIKMARFSIRGVAFSCQRCGDSWVAFITDDDPDKSPSTTLVRHSSIRHSQT